MIHQKMLVAVGVFAVFAATLFVGVSNSWAHIPNPPPPPVLNGRWTGGGSFFTGANDFFAPSGTRITFGMELHCDVTDTPNNLEVQVHMPDGTGGMFHLETLTYAFCWYADDINPAPPAAPFNTIYGQGIGKYNGVEGYCADFEFTDAGEPGSKTGDMSTNDWVHTLRIWSVDPTDFATYGCAGNPSGAGTHFLFSVNEDNPPGYLGHALDDGNFQAHFDNK